VYEGRHMALTSENAKRRTAARTIQRTIRTGRDWQHGLELKNLAADGMHKVLELDRCGKLVQDLLGNSCSSKAASSWWMGILEGSQVEYWDAGVLGSSSF
jgi:hypothetical protein